MLDPQVYSVKKSPLNHSVRMLSGASERFELSLVPGAENRYGCSVDPRIRLPIRIIAFAAFSALCYFGAAVIITIVLAILIAYMLDPIVNLLRRVRIPRPVAAVFVMLVSGVIVGAMLTLLFDRANEFSENLPKYSTRIQKVSRDIRNRIMVLRKRGEVIGKTILPTTNEPKPLTIQQYSSYRDFFFRDLGPVYDVLIQVSFFPFLVYFLLMEKEKLQQFVTSLMRSRTSLSDTYVQGTSDRVVDDINKKVRGFVLGYLISNAIVFGTSWLLFLAMGVQEAVIWAVLFTALNMLPFIGAILSVLPPLLIAIVQFTSIQQGVLLVVLCASLHLVYANWLIPRTTGPRTELSPLVTLLAMMYWGFLWGAIGIFLAIPLTASLRSIWMAYRALPEFQPEQNATV